MTEYSLSPAFCLHNGVLLLGSRESSVVFGLVDSADEELRLRLVRSVRSCFSGAVPKPDGIALPSVEFVALSKDEFSRGVERLFAPKASKPHPSGSDADDGPSCRADNAAAALLDSILSNASAQDATDIHIESCGIRFRAKGLLSEHSSVDASCAAALVRRIKVLSNLSITETHIPQDGQFSFLGTNGHPVYVRVSCMPAVGKSPDCESVVLRLLDMQRVPLKLDGLGFTKSQLCRVRALCRLPFGLVLVCGATGSGKSTTAGAMLEYLRTESGETRKLVSLEDPPEYVLPGVTQIAVRPEKSMSFEVALRSVFRQDPDVILIGEIRDACTARTAVQAALTGHLVIATLHTATASQAVLRLCELSAEKDAVHSVLRGVIAQKMDARGMRAEVTTFPSSAGKERIA